MNEINTLDSEKLKRIFANNLNRLMGDKQQNDVANKLNISTATFSSWCVGKRMPRMDKIEILANYFGVPKSDLIEEKPATKVSDERSLIINEIMQFVGDLTPELQKSVLVQVKALSQSKE